MVSKQLLEKKKVVSFPIIEKNLYYKKTNTKDKFVCKNLSLINLDRKINFYINLSLPKWSNNLKKSQLNMKYDKNNKLFFNTMDKLNEVYFRDSINT